jgi:hypothetical protein
VNDRAGTFSDEKLASNASMKNQGTTWIQSERKIQAINLEENWFPATKSY